MDVIESEEYEVVPRARVSRRKVLGAGFAAGAATALSPLGRMTGIAGAAAGGQTASAGGAATVARASTGLNFAEIAPGMVDLWRMPHGYVGNVLIAWGDPIFAGEPWRNVLDLTPADQERRFGFNCDYVAFLPIDGASSDRRGLLWVNHEYTEGNRMFRNYVGAESTLNQVKVELAGHGGTVLEVERSGDGWVPVLSSNYNRRITATTRMLLSGPAAGHRLLKTSADVTGTTVFGMLNNCGGGVTPWGTVLTAEENFNQYFANAGRVTDAAVRTSYARYGVPTAASERGWERHVTRFDLASEPNEAFRFGWIVEIDPTDPTFVPRKRTALGRFKHEAGSCAVSADDRPVVYSGDDERFDYVYKFVGDRKIDPSNRAANLDLLDHGSLYVAKFNDNGTGEWMKLTVGNPLIGAKFDSQADVLIRTREAADALSPTKMDRPEDIDWNPVNKKLYIAFTNNTNRAVGTNATTNAANPRAANRFGHIIEMAETGGDAAALTFTWTMFMLCGPKSDSSRAFAGKQIADAPDISCPDNFMIDKEGNLWIACDGQQGTIQQTDCLFAVPTEGPNRGVPKRFMSGPLGCEITGPAMNPSNTALFAAIQHPGENGTLAKAESRWPDYNTQWAGRPAVVWITKPGADNRIGS